jgi:hypothetical protein
MYDFSDIFFWNKVLLEIFTDKPDFETEGIIYENQVDQPRSQALRVVFLYEREEPGNEVAGLVDLVLGTMDTGCL